MGIVADWASITVTLLLGIVGTFVALSINRDVRLKLAERRLAAYERLWSLMRPASPYEAPLDSITRQEIHKNLTDWYYANGDGMLLERVSRSVYLEAKDNLVRPTGSVTPRLVRQRLASLPLEEAEKERGKVCQRQLSLLRTQLKSDLEIYGRPYGPKLGREDREFLACCNVNISTKPWNDQK